jgi:hypothetical protein
MGRGIVACILAIKKIGSERYCYVKIRYGQLMDALLVKIFKCDFAILKNLVFIFLMESL